MINRRLWAFALILHGVIHMLGFQAAWGVGSIEEFSPNPAFPSVAAGSVAAHMLGALWLLAGAAFLATAMLVVQGHRWWRPAAGAAALLSLAVCGMWWQDAPAGAAVDLLLLAWLARPHLHPSTLRLAAPRPVAVHRV